jgi:hypothetical protein
MSYQYRKFLLRYKTDSETTRWIDDMASRMDVSPDNFIKFLLGLCYTAHRTGDASALLSILQSDGNIVRVAQAPKTELIGDDEPITKPNQTHIRSFLQLMGDDE